MGYIAKQLILKAYKSLSNLTEDHKQGQTQFVSAIRHFIAFEMFYKKEQRDCDLKNKDDRDSFVANVVKIVNVEGDFYTANFHTTIKELADCGVGSNFTSVGVIAKSLTNTSTLFYYPIRGQNPLIEIKNSILIHNEELVKNINNYLANDELKLAFIIWLLRNDNIEALNEKSLIQTLSTIVSNNIVKEMMPSTNILQNYIDNETLVDSKEIITKSDLLNIFRNSPTASFNTKFVQYTNYLTAIRTKPFLLLAGISGTGKSRIVRELAFKSCPKYLQDKDGTTPGNYCMIEVKPNWHDSTELLGYYSNLSKSYQFKKFVKFLIKAKMSPDVPFFVCLDEMNLAPVEQYFAEILSVLETRKVVTEEDGSKAIKTGVIIDAEHFKALGKIGGYSPNFTDRDIYMKLHDIDTENDINEEVGNRTDLTTDGLTLPDNVIIIGTVNMDDTTHQFSRKVIDRAMTIEMNGGKLKNMFGGSKNLAYLEKDEQQKWQAAFKQKYVSADEVLVAHADKADDIVNLLPEKLESINAALKGTPFEVSYRVLNELTIMVGVMLDDSPEEELETIVNSALDRILLMKILPRIEGDRDMFDLKEPQKIGDNTCHDRLEWLRELAPAITHDDENGYHQQTAKEKIEEMIERLGNQEFTRFWP